MANGIPTTSLPQTSDADALLCTFTAGGVSHTGQITLSDLAQFVAAKTVVLPGPVTFAEGLTPERVYIDAAWVAANGSTYVVDADDSDPVFHLIDYNGTFTVDVSALANFKKFTFNIADYAKTSIIFDCGTGNTFTGSATRDGYPASQAIEMRGGESITIRRTTGTKFAAEAGVANLDVVHIDGETITSMWEQPDGTYDVYLQRSANANGLTNFDVSVSGKAIDFTGARLTSMEIFSTAQTTFSPPLIESLGSTGNSGRAAVYNPNGTALSIAMMLKKVTVEAV